MTNEYKYISDDLESVIKRLDSLEVKDDNHKLNVKNVISELDKQRVILINLSYRHEILYNGRL